MMDLLCQEFLDRVTESSEILEKVERDFCLRWSPESPPITPLFSAIGKEIVRRWEEISGGECLMRYVEEAITSDSEMLRNAVGSGLLEAMYCEAEKVEGGWEKIEPLLGVESRAHVVRWLDITEDGHTGNG